MFVSKCLKIINSDSFQQLFGKIILTKETESHFETQQNGGRYATSTGGTIVGVHSNVIINDDLDNSLKKIRSIIETKKISRQNFNQLFHNNKFLIK
jgi:hypothetical protein